MGRGPRRGQQNQPADPSVAPGSASPGDSSPDTDGSLLQAGSGVTGRGRRTEAPSPARRALPPRDSPRCPLRRGGTAQPKDSSQAAAPTPLSSEVRVRLGEQRGGGCGSQGCTGGGAGRGRRRAVRRGGWRTFSPARWAANAKLRTWVWPEGSGGCRRVGGEGVARLACAAGRSRTAWEAAGAGSKGLRDQLGTTEGTTCRPAEGTRVAEQAGRAPSLCLCNLP